MDSKPDKPINKKNSDPHGYVRLRIATYRKKEEIEKSTELIHQGYEGFDCAVDRFLANKKAGKEEARAKNKTPKWLRPQCGAKTRSGRPCRALAVWDKNKDKPRNGRCRIHGGLSTGAKTEEGKRRSLQNLKQYRGVISPLEVVQDL